MILVRFMIIWGWWGSWWWWGGWWWEWWWRRWCWGGGGGRWWCRRGKPIPRQESTLCASLRSRNAHGHFTRAILCGNLQKKMPHTPATTSIKHRALTLTVRTPSVWPHCLGNEAYSKASNRGKSVARTKKYSSHTMKSEQDSSSWRKRLATTWVFQRLHLPRITGPEASTPINP